MKTFIIGDIHNKWGQALTAILQQWKTHGRPDRIIFVGDLVNDWNSTVEDEILSLEQLTNWVLNAREQGIRVDVLAGNHEIPYLTDFDSPQYHAVIPEYAPGYRFGAHHKAQELLGRLRLQLATTLTVDDRFTVVSHAGFTTNWLHTYVEEDTLTLTAVEKANLYLRQNVFTPLLQLGRERGGYSNSPSPVWAGKNELIADPAPGADQIVGHTPVKEITRETVNGHTLTFVDTFSTYMNGKPIGDKSILVIDD
jgi:hypothetical protein